ELDLIVRDVCLDLRELALGRLRLLALALKQIFAVLDRLLEARDLGADLVVVALHGVEALVALRELDAQLLDLRLDVAKRRDGRLEADLLLGERSLVLLDVRAQRRQTQRQELGRRPALLRLQRLVPLGVLRLPLEMRELL